MRKPSDAKPSTPAPQRVPSAQQSSHDRDGTVPSHAVQEQDEMQAATEQMGEHNRLQLNEGGRTNDSRETENPEGAVHGLPAPALKGTWR